MPVKDIMIPFAVKHFLGFHVLPAPMRAGRGTWGHSINAISGNTYAEFPGDTAANVTEGGLWATSSCMWNRAHKGRPWGGAGEAQGQPTSSLPTACTPGHSTRTGWGRCSFTLFWKFLTKKAASAAQHLWEEGAITVTQYGAALQLRQTWYLLPQHLPSIIYSSLLSCNVILLHYWMWT